MDVDRVRRALVAAVLGGGVAGGFVPPVGGYLERFAPLSGAAWESATERVGGTVESPYGPAEVRYDDYGVPHVSAGGDGALYFAVGYAQAADRLFGMDLQRRVTRGEVSAAVGEVALDSDRFHARMDFVGAAEANWELLGDEPAGAAVEAFSDGVNAYLEDGPLPVEFGLLGYEPDPWTPIDTMLMEKRISWGLTGDFRTLRRAAVADALGADAAGELYPSRLDHDTPILRGRSGGAADRASPPGDGVGTGLVDWLSRFESPRGIGSNSWVVSGEHTESGAPIVANDPHLPLVAPPVWYEMNLRADSHGVRGVTFPGVPFVVVGENDAGAWGFTNANADVIDFYRYEVDGDRYRYGDGWRRFDTETRTIEVADGDDREVEVRKTVHGPFVEREGEGVGVAWTGLAATATTAAIHGYNHSEGMDDVLAATERFDLPTQNLVYADRDGNTLYYLTGRLPIRRVGGERVAGDRVFDGSAGEAEWRGFEPYGIPSWEGFVPFGEKPGVVNPGYVATANQRIVDDPDHYIAAAYSPPYRGRRIYGLLDRRVRSDDPVDPAFARRVQLDTVDGRAVDLVPDLVDAARGGDGLGDAADALDGWDYRMVPGSAAALLFARWFEHYRRELFADAFGAAGLDESYYPNDWVVANLEGGRWFDGSRAAAMRRALRAAVDEIDEEGWEAYGDYSHTGAIDHPFDQPFLNYPAIPAPGSDATVRNYAVGGPHGSSWRMIAPMDGPSEGVIPGGNDGDPLSAHYDDQLRMWAAGEYKPMDRGIRGDLRLSFEGPGEGDR